VHRFFAPALDPGDETVTLPRDESEHLTRVLRLGPGDTVSVFDGRGREWLARVQGGARREVRVQLLSAIQPPPEPHVHLTLAAAVLKGDRMDEVIRDAVMLGVSAIQPLVTKRTETTIATLSRGQRVERWRRVALASVKQSGRAVLPEVRQPLTLEHLLDEPAASARLMFVEPGAAQDVEPITRLRQAAQPTDAVIIVGPEGGWDSREVQHAATRGVRLISLGPRTLRADAVPVAAISVLQFLWEPG